jgi:putative ABC transport system permease protein
MRILLSLALRNVFRHRSRSAFTVLAIGFGVLMSLLLGSVVFGLGDLMLGDVVHGKVGALQVHKRGYDDVKENLPIDRDLPADGTLEAKIRAVPGVTGLTGRILFAGILSNGATSTFVLGNGQDPQGEYKVLPLADRGLVGQRLSIDKPSGAVVGYELASAMGVKTGGTLTIQAANRGGQQNALDLDVSGTINNNSPLESKRVVYLPLAYAQDLLDMKGRVTEFAVSIADIERVDEVAAVLQRRLGPGYHVQTWKELRPQMVDILQVQKVLLLSVCFVFLIIAVIGVINTMLMSVLERTREIGTMMAVGVRRGFVVVLFLLEALTLALLGAASGAIGAYGIIALVVARGGIPASPPGSTAVITLLPSVPVWLLAVAVVATTLGVLAAAAYPSFRASRLRPVEALRAI